MRGCALVVGIGNPLRGDDGVGPAVIEALEGRVDRARVVLLASHQLTPELAEAVSEAARVVFVDASTAAAPGTVADSELSPEAPRATRFSHAVAPTALVELSRTLYGKAGQAFVVTVGANSFDSGAPLSAAVRAAVPLAAERVLALLR